MFITYLGLKMGPNIKLSITKKVGICFYDERTPMVWISYFLALVCKIVHKSLLGSTHFLSWNWSKLFLCKPFDSKVDSKGQDQACEKEFGFSILDKCPLFSMKSNYNFQLDCNLCEKSRMNHAYNNVCNLHNTRIKTNNYDWGKINYI